MDTSERKTLKLMKLVSFGTICLILATLYVLAQYQNDKGTTSIVAGTKLELISENEVLSLKTFPWATESFTQEITNEKISYINYWAQWCEPCLSEIPYLQKLAEQNPNISLTFVNVDSKDNLDKAKKWWASNGFNFNTFYPKFETNILKHTRGLPYHQIYDKRKNMVSHFTGNIEGKEGQLNLLLNSIK